MLGGSSMHGDGCRHDPNSASSCWCYSSQCMVEVLLSIEAVLVAPQQGQQQQAVTAANSNTNQPAS